MKKLATLAAVSLLTLTGVAAVAQTPQGQAPSTPPGAGTGPGASAPAEFRHPRGPNAADLRSIVDARLAGVPAGLKLTPEQQQLWPAVEQALRATAYERIGRIEERFNAGPGGREGQDRDLMQRLDERSRRVSERAQRLQSYASAMRPFWASLTEDQKRVLPILIRPRPIGELGSGGDGRRGGWRERGERRGGMMMQHHRDGHGGGGEHRGGDRR